MTTNVSPPPQISGAKVKNGPDFKSLGLKSPMEVIDILSLLKVDGELVVKDDKVILDPKLKAQAVMTYFNKNFGISPQDLPHLAARIKHALKHRKIKMDGENRIVLSREFIQNLLKEIKHSQIPPELRTARKALPKTPIDPASAPKTPIKLEKLNLYPETPSAESHVSNYQQPDNATVEELGYHLLANTDNIKEILNPKKIKYTSATAQKEGKILAGVA